MLHLRTAALFLLALSFLSAQDAAPAAKPSPEASQFEVKRFEAASLDGAEVPYGVYTPAGQHEGPLPLVIWLHGMWEDHERFHSRGGTKVLDTLIADETIPPLILVAPFGGRSSFWTNGKETGRYEDLVTKDLLAEITRTLPVAKERGQRAIAGVSMGGLGALKIALRHPELFQAVSAHSAALFPPDPERLGPRFQAAYERWGERMGLDQIFGRPIDGAIWRANNPLAQAAQTKPEVLAGLAIRFDAGDRDRYGFHEPGQALGAIMKKRGIPHTFKLLEGVGHSWRDGAMSDRLKEGLTFIAAAWKKAAEAPKND